MGVRIKIARTAGELKGIFAARHRVFVDEDKYLPNQGGCILDLYDAIPTTTNFIAVDGGTVIGGVRLTRDGEVGFPADKFIDFREGLPADADVIACSMLCLQNAYRGNRALLGGLLMMGAYWATAQGATHLCAPVNPAIEGALKRIGFRAVGPAREAQGLPTLPMVLSLAEMSDAYLEFIRKQDVGLWVENFEREFFPAGEVIIASGSKGACAFVLVNGEAVVLPYDGAPIEEAVATIQRGQVFGELALLTDLERSATVVATQDTEAMVLEREAFERQLQASPERAMGLLRDVGRAFHNLVLSTQAPKALRHAS